MKKTAIYILTLLSLIFLLYINDESHVAVTLNANDFTLYNSEVFYDYIQVTETAPAGRFASGPFPEYVLNKGTYTVNIQYQTTGTDNYAAVIDNGTEVSRFALPAGTAYTTHTFTLENDSPALQFHLYYAGTGELYVTNLELVPHAPFYMDTFFYMSLVVILGWLVVFLYWYREKHQVPVPTQLTFFILIAVALLASLPLLNNTFAWGDDVCYHMARIEGIKNGLLDGQFPVYIYPEALEGNGYLNCMYPNLFLYIPAVLRILGVSLTASYKFLLVLTHFATAFITYYSVKSISKVRHAALLASFLYTLCNYRFVNFYARQALGEALAMTFLPLVIAGIYHIVTGEKKKWPLLFLGMSGLLQTHILSVLLGAVICFVVCIVFVKELFKEKRIVSLLQAAGMTIVVNLWFIVPFIYYYFAGDLSTQSVNWSTYSEYSLYFSGLFFSALAKTTDFRQLTFGLSITLCIFIVLLKVLCEKGNKEEQADNRFLLTLFTLGCVFTFMMSELFPGKQLMYMKPVSFFLQTLQFPWRLLAPCSLLFVITGCIFLTRSSILKSYSKYIAVLMIAFTLLSMQHTENNFAYENYDSVHTIGHENKLQAIPKGEKTITYPYEWRPVGASDDTLTTDIILSDADSLQLNAYKKTGTTAHISYVSSNADAYIELPLLNYKGYRAVDEAGNELDITSGENSRIRIYSTGDGAEHQITVAYKGFPVFTIAFLCSIISMLIFLFRNRLLAWYAGKKSK